MLVLYFLGAMLVSDDEIARALDAAARQNTRSEAMACVEDYSVKLATKTAESAEAIGRLAPRLCADKISKVGGSSANDVFDALVELSTRTAAKCRIKEFADERCDP